MKYSEMKVWSAGENGKTKKNELVSGVIMLIMWFILCVMFFTIDMDGNPDAKMTIWEHIFIGLYLSIMSGLFFGSMGYLTVSLALRALRDNKEITLQLYNFDDFMKLNSIPDGKKVVYSDDSGFVLCDEADECQYNDWQGLSKKDLYFFKFEEYFNKYKGDKREVVVG